MRFSLFTLLAVTTFAALACAALVKPSVDWLSLVVTLCALSWTVQTLRLLFLNGPSRAAAGGWLLFATAYVALVYGWWTHGRLGPLLISSQAIQRGQEKWFASQTADVTDMGLSDVLALSLPRNSAPVTITIDSSASWSTVDGLFGLLPTDPTVSVAGLFQATAHWLSAWLAGWMGAALAATFHRRAQQKPTRWRDNL